MGRQKGLIMGWKKMLLLFTLIAVFFLLSVISSSEAASTSNPEAQDKQLLRTQNASQSNMTHPLEETVRIDPINHFKKYRGGYDIRNKHYWSSTAFTGVYGYTIGLIWLISGIIYGGFFLLRRFYFKHRKNAPCYKKCCIKHTAFATFLTVLAIFATGLVLYGSAHYHSRSRTILRIIISTEDDASHAIRYTTRAMNTISHNLASRYVVGRYAYVSRSLKSESKNLNSKADKIERQAERHRRSIGKGLSIVFITSLVVVLLNLISVLALSVSGVLRFQRATTLFIALCWILTVLCWTLFGIYFFLQNFSKDTCTALSDFQQNPNRSSLSSILPCVRLASSRSALHRVSVQIYNLVNKANANITTLRKTTYPDLIYVCNPFSGPPEYLYKTEDCPSNTIKIGDIPQVLKLFTCSENSKVSCKQGEFITSNEFYTIQAVTSSVQSLLDVYPVMQSLIECWLVKDSFDLILDKECKPWKVDASLAWSATLGLAVVMTTLILVCVKLHCKEETSLES